LEGTSVGHPVQPPCRSTQPGLRAQGVTLQPPPASLCPGPPSQRCWGVPAPSHPPWRCPCPASECRAARPRGPSSSRAFRCVGQRAFSCPSRRAGVFPSVFRALISSLFISGRAAAGPLGGFAKPSRGEGRAHLRRETESATGVEWWWLLLGSVPGQ